MSKKPVLYDIKVATGLAITLVVIGHLASRGQDGIEYYVSLKKVIYKFHMPLFLSLSGYVAYYTYKPINSIESYRLFVKKKFKRLFPAYLILSLVFLGGKAILAQELGVVKGVVNILFYPSLSTSGFLWYIYVLFLYYLTLPLIDYLLKKSFFLLFTTSLIISTFVKITQLFSLDLYFWYLPFFIFGAFLSTKREAFNVLLKRYGLVFLVLFLIWGVLEFFEVVSIHKNIVGFFGVVGVLYFTSIIIKRSTFVENIGDNSFFIYLFNSMFIGAFTFVLTLVVGKETFYNIFYYVMPFMIVLGLLGPIILQRMIISKVPFLKDWIR